MQFYLPKFGYINIIENSETKVQLENATKFTHFLQNFYIHLIGYTKLSAS